MQPTSNQITNKQKLQLLQQFMVEIKKTKRQKAETAEKADQNAELILSEL